MTYQIAKSLIIPQGAGVSYADAVAKFSALVTPLVNEMTVWHEHDLKAKAAPPLPPAPRIKDFTKEKNPGAAYLDAMTKWQAQKLARHEPYPMPVGHPLVVQAIAAKLNADGSTTYEADFEVINDDPTPAQVLQTKKDALLATVLLDEQEALAKVQLPVGKRRLADIREHNIRVKHNSALDAAKAAFAQQEKALDPAKFDPKEYVDRLAAMESAVTNAQDPDDVGHLKAQEDRRAAFNSVIQKVAIAMSDIEDLTADNIDAYQIPLLTAAPS